MDALSLVLIAGWDDLQGISKSRGMKGQFTNLDDFITREPELWDVHCITGHEIAIQDSKNRLVGDYEDVALLTLQFEDNRFHSNSNIVVRLREC